MHLRSKIFSAALLLSFLVLIVRLFFWQIIKGKDLSKEARIQYQKEIVVTAPRGNILANDGSILAARDDAYLVYAYLPKVKDDYSKIADQLAPLFIDKGPGEEEYNEKLLDEANRIKSILNRENTSWIPLKHKVTPNVKNTIEALHLSGIGFELEETRAYPEASTAANLLGFVGKDAQGRDKGYFGIEGNYDLTLSGKPGYLSRESDASGIPILLGETRETLAIEGVDLLTNIDKAIQLIVEKGLKEGIERYGASAGTVIVMNPASGGIVASASYPSYDPKNYTDYSDEVFKDPAISAGFEPGSVFKVVIMASALDAGVVEKDTKCDICGGPLKVDKYVIETWDKKYRPDSNMVDAIVHSDNVGMVFVAQKLGADRLFEYLNRFGIGKTTGIDLQGEFTPMLREKGTWNIVDVSTAGFGQGVAVTPIQLLRSVSAIANGGVMVTPKVIQKIIGDDWEQEIKVPSPKRVISKEASREVTLMMVEAAKKGEAKWTHLRGYRVAGKTGTAQIPIAGHYDKEKTIASFVGFAPYDDPKFVMLVTLREPSSSPWASETAAPLWYSIAKELFYYFGIQPE